MEQSIQSIIGDIRARQFVEDIHSLLDNAAKAFGEMSREDYQNFFSDMECHGFASACSSREEPPISMLGNLINTLMELQHTLDDPDWEWPDSREHEGD